MNQALIKYLHTLAHELRALPPQKREAEMQQHLEAIIARQVESGVREEEAVAAALAQFGQARTVGRQLRKSAARSDRRRIAALIGAACHGALWLLVTSLMDLGGVQLEVLPTLDKMLDLNIANPITIGFGALFWMIPFASGVLAGRIAKTRRVVLDVLAVHYILYALVVWLARGSGAGQMMSSTWMPLLLGVYAGAAPASWIGRWKRVKRA